MTTPHVSSPARPAEPIFAEMGGSRPNRWGAIWVRGLSARSPQAFAFAVVCVAAATALHAAIGLIRPGSVIFDPYYAATLVAALVGGSEAGALAMVLGGVIAYWMFAPAEWKFTVLALDLVNWALYGTSSVVILWAAASYRGLVQRLREEERRRRLVNDELAHRLKNTMASVQSIVNQSLAGERELCGKIGERLMALTATNDLLVHSGWRTASLKDIVANEFKPYDLARIAWRGDEVQCPSEVATALTLIIHELATNAVKHGALSTPRGRIDIAWHETDGRLTLAWVESGGLPVAPPRRRGFGTKLLDSVVKGFDGSVETGFAPSGLTCTISLTVPEPRPSDIGFADAAG